MPIGGGFSLRPGTDMTVYLTYAIIAGNAPDIEELRKRSSTTANCRISNPKNA